jgi:hypothetical protein
VWSPFCLGDRKGAANIAVGNTKTLSEYVLTAAIHVRAVKKRSNDDPKTLIAMRAIDTCDEFAQQVKSDHYTHRIVESQAISASGQAARRRSEAGVYTLTGPVQTETLGNYATAL